MARRPDGDTSRSLPSEDDWFAAPAAGPLEPEELAWQDETREWAPPRRASDPGRREALAVLAIVAAVLLVVAGVLVVRAIGGSGTPAAGPTTPLLPTAPTTPPATTPTTPTTPTGTTPTGPGTTTPVGALPTTGVVLKRGMNGADVKALQAALTKLGFSPGAADGDFGPATEQAVTAFQQAKGLTADGVAGPKTLAAVNTALGIG